MKTKIVFTRDTMLIYWSTYLLILSTVDKESLLGIKNHNEKGGTFNKLFATCSNKIFVNQKKIFRVIKISRNAPKILTKGTSNQ